MMKNASYIEKFVCYLDVQKAFDRMRHNGLYVKRYDMGLRSKLLGIIIE